MCQRSEIALLKVTEMINIAINMENIVTKTEE